MQILGGHGAECAQEGQAGAVRSDGRLRCMCAHDGTLQHIPSLHTCMLCNKVSFFTMAPKHGGARLHVI